jgi:hypothetical protein
LKFHHPKTTVAVLLCLIGIVASTALAWQAMRAFVAPARAVTRTAVLCEHSADIADARARESFESTCAELNPQVERMVSLLDLHVIVLLATALGVFALSLVKLVDAWK